MTKRIVVTGGAGFIGSHLCDALIAQHHQVTCIDNLFTGSLDNISHLETCANFTFIKHDIIDPFHDIESVDEIYHLACPASPIHYQHNAIRTIKTAVIGSMNMLGLAKRTGAKILLASTSEVYGDPLCHPQPESYWGNVNPIGARSCYDEGKRCAESLAFNYHRQNNVRIKIARIFNTYGPRMHPNDGRVVSNFIVQALSGEAITIYGDGQQSRSFCYVDDMVDGLIKLMNSDDTLTGPINLGNPTELTIKALAELILQACSSSSTLIFKDLPEDDPLQRQPDTTLSKKHLNWSSSTDLSDGIDRTIQYFNKK